MNVSERHTGGCLCGEIHFVLEGTPLSTNICHCTQCQRQTGAPLPSFATFAAAALKVVQGTPAVYRSSERAIREFCSRCGSTLFWRELGGQEVDVFLGAFDEPGRLPPPTFAIWVQHRVPWLPDLPGVVAYPGGR